jgi:Flp pilus assembly protein TadD
LPADLTLAIPARPSRRRCWPALLLAGCLAAAGGAWAADPAANLPRDIELQFRRGEPTTALARLDQALAQRPGDANLQFLKGVLLGESGDAAGATLVFERMTEEFPELPEPYNNLAVLQASAGQLDRARSLLENALRLDPGYRAASENLGDVFARLARRAYAQAAADATAEARLQRKLRLAGELAQSR